MTPWIHRLQWLFILLLTIGTLVLWNRLGDLSSEMNHLQESVSAAPGTEIEVHAEMATLQNFLHKLAFALGEESVPVSEFYLHEMEETIHALIEAGVMYDGFAVSDLTETMLLPSFESLEEGVEEERWTEIPDRLNILVQSCNQCHQATDHGEIVITTRADSNPFNQDFSAHP